MAYAILRLEKLSNLKQIAGRINHSYRLLQDKPELIQVIYEKFKVEQGKAVSQYFKTLDKHIEKTTGKKPRKDNVRTLELVLTASPEFFKDLPQDKFNEWLERNRQFLFNTFGKDNVISIILHLDETTPHLHAFVSTYDQELNKYNTQKWTGDKYKLTQLQDVYYGYVQDLGLQRGVSSQLSRKHHIKLRDYWKKLPTINELVNEINELNKKIQELQEENQKLKQIQDKVKQAKDLEKQMQELQKQNEYKGRAIKEYIKIIQKLQEDLQTLTHEYKEVKNQVKKLTKENKELQEQNEKLLNYIINQTSNQMNL